MLTRTTFSSAEFTSWLRLLKCSRRRKEFFSQTRTQAVRWLSRWTGSLSHSSARLTPTGTVVAYINTTASLKTVCDVCVTSSSALRIVKALDTDKILFIPDCNLGSWVQKQVPEKDIKLLHGGCPTHAAITAKEALKAREEHPNALFLVHPECVPAVVELADYVGSTSGIMQFAKGSDCKEFIIGTETSISEHLQYDCPDKKFYPVTKNIVCRNMKLTTLPDVYNSLKGMDNGEAFEILMDDKLIADARKCIDEMIRLGG